MAVYDQDRIFNSRMLRRMTCICPCVSKDARSFDRHRRTDEQTPIYYSLSWSSDASTRTLLCDNKATWKGSILGHMLC